jgi:hypothetical protein
MKAKTTAQARRLDDMSNIGNLNGHSRTERQTTLQEEMTESYLWPNRTIESWEDFLDLAARSQPSMSPFGTDYLLRGHADETWPLRSSLLRLLGSGVTAEEALATEGKLLDIFKAQSHLHLRGYPLPGDDDLLAWWALMQHHGAPTRLVDWTASPYVAAYFAVESAWDRAGTIWFIHPYTLADAFGRLPLTGRPLREVMVDPAAYDGVFAVPPRTQQSDRLVAQQGHFTVPVNVLGDQARLLLDACDNPVADESDIMGKLIVPAHLKPEFLHRLRAMNVTATSLFPGIDGLGRSIAEAARLQGFALSLTRTKGASRAT